MLNIQRVYCAEKIFIFMSKKSAFESRPPLYSSGPIGDQVALGTVGGGEEWDNGIRLEACEGGDAPRARDSRVGPILVLLGKARESLLAVRV